MTAFGFRIRLRPAIRCLWALCLIGILYLVPGIAAEPGRVYNQIRREDVAPGVKYYHFQNEYYPISFNMLRVQWRESFILPRTILGDGKLMDLEPVSRQATEASNQGRYAVAAVNGDFYKSSGVPLGIFIVEREIISAVTTGKSSRSAFIIGERGKPDVDVIGIDGKLRDPAGRSLSIDGVNRERGYGDLVLYTPAMGSRTPTNENGGITEVTLSGITGADARGWQCFPEYSYRARVAKIRTGKGGSSIPSNGAVLSSSGSKGEALARWGTGQKIRFQFFIQGEYKYVKSAIGGWPVIVENGRNIRKLMDEPRHPRTAIGYNDKEIMILAVDGRRNGWSRGMTLYELGELMERAKCQEAINLDGGGSTTMWVRGKIKNKPSDGKERSVSNAFVVYSTAPKTHLSRLVIDPPELSILANEEIQFIVSGQDKYFNPTDLNLGGLSWQASQSVGNISNRGTFRSASRETQGYVKVSYGHLHTEVGVRVYNAPPIFQISPLQAHLFPGESINFRTIASDHGGRPIVGSYDRILEWKASPNIGIVDSIGSFQAGQGLGKGYVTVSIGGVSRQAYITVGTVERPLDGFERTSVWSFSTYPENALRGSFQISNEAAFKGAYGGLLKYHFTDSGKIQACYGRTDIGIPRSPMAISVWVRGDGSSHDLRIAYRDRNNSRHTEGFEEDTLKNTSWHQATARIPADTEFPIRIESIYVLREDEDTAHMSGTIRLDNLSVHYPPE